MLLARPTPDGIETVNDLDGFVANFWRALQADPDGVAFHADWPVNENDLHARHVWLVNQKDSMQTRLEGDPEWFDVKVAGWWVWGMACWIGSGFCSGQGPWQVIDGKLVHLGDAGQGVNRKLVHLGDAGQGVNRQLVHLGNAGRGVNRKRPALNSLGGGAGVCAPGISDLQEYMRALAERLRRVRVCCGDWSRVCGPTPTFGHGLTAVFLDPPYSHEVRNKDLYRQEMACADAVRDWAVANGDNSLMRIALCGYDGEHELPGWSVLEWSASGGYEGQAEKKTNNRKKERVWFSPFCLKPDVQKQLW